MRLIYLLFRMNGSDRVQVQTKDQGSLVATVEDLIMYGVRREDDLLFKEVTHIEALGDGIIHFEVDYEA